MPIRRNEEITLYRRYAWFFTRRRTAKFAKFKAVTYGYRDTSVSSWFNAAHDGFDVFSVGLRAESGEEFHLFDFVGEGTFTNNSIWGDWQYTGNSLFDLSGSQESESKTYVEVLSKMMGVRVAPPGSGAYSPPPAVTYRGPRKSPTQAAIPQLSRSMRFC
ncbi:MAG: hypothetical protein QM775_03625 [Pirellulales bacterium]